MTRAKRMLSKRAISAIALTLALIVPAGASALGLGEARVESFLNQPLDVRMRLLDVSEDDLDSLTVAPASPEDFERLGLMSDSLALGIQIAIDRSVSPPVVRVTSDRPVTDPVVQLLVDARWASGRMLREYTLFLDPPTVAVEPPAPARSARQATPAASESEREAPAPARPTQAPRTQESRPQQARPVAASGASSYGPVASGDTLWSIARANLPAADVSMNQMMIAIVELNPNAFRDRNINQLLRGAELQLPDAERARALDAAATAAEVAAQNRAFRGRTASDVPTVSSAGRDSSPASDASAAPDMAGRPEQADAADPVDHRLSLVPPGDEQSGNGLSGDAAEVADLRQRLARAEEELYAARQEAEEFQSRVEDLETAIRENPGGVGIRDAELAGLEATLRAAREATREDADPQMRAEVSERLEGYLEQYESAAQDATGSEQLAFDDSGQDIADEAAAGQDESPTGTADETTADAAGVTDEAADVGSTPAPERAVTEISSSRGLLGNPMLLLFGGLIVLLAILAIIRIAVRRSRPSAEPEAPLKRASELPGATPPAEDPRQAARSRVAENPDDPAAHLALLQTLASDGEQAEFGEALEAMYVHVDSDSQPEWREALDLAGRVVPGHSLVKGSSDWVADAPQREADEPVSEVDEESEVDDLMTRLDADLDESDDRDWLDEGEASEPEGPLLREDEDSDRGGSSAGEKAASAPDEIEEDIDFGGWGDADEASRDTSESDEQASVPDQEQGADEDEDEDLVLDWQDEDTPAAQAGHDSTAESVEGDDPGAEDDQAEDDIFAQSDDDIDVKLDLAKAYLSWNSTDSARTLLEEVAREGNESQRDEARALLDDISDGSEG